LAPLATELLGHLAVLVAFASSHEWVLLRAEAFCREPYNYTWDSMKHFRASIYLSTHSLYPSLLGNVLMVFLQRVSDALLIRTWHLPVFL
jgi:hypothetical protein